MINTKESSTPAEITFSADAIVNYKFQYFS